MRGAEEKDDDDDDDDESVRGWWQRREGQAAGALDSNRRDMQLALHCNRCNMY